jgi:hypothetical protein
MAAMTLRRSSPEAKWPERYAQDDKAVPYNAEKAIQDIPAIQSSGGVDELTVAAIAAFGPSVTRKCTLGPNSHVFGAR